MVELFCIKPDTKFHIVIGNKKKNKYILCIKLKS